MLCGAEYCCAPWDLTDTIIWQVRGVAYGTLEYILRLELNKRSLPNRMLYGFTSICVLGTTTTCVIIAAVRVAQDGRSLLALLIYGLDLLLQGIACFILFTEVRFRFSFQGAFNNCVDRPYGS
jgi:hypothetical protein